MVLADERCAVPHDLVDGLHHVGIRTEGERAAARVQPNADLGRRGDRCLDVRTGGPGRMEVVLVGNRRDAAEQRLGEHRGRDRLDVLGFEAAAAPPLLEDRAEPAEPRADERALERRDRAGRALVEVLMRVDESGQHHETGAVDHPVATVGRQVRADCRDRGAVHEHVGAGELGSVVVERRDQRAAAQ